MKESTKIPGSSQHPKSSSFSREELANRLYYIFMTLSVLVLTGFMLIMGGMPRLTLAILILLIIGVNLVNWLRERTETWEIWEQEEEFEEMLNLKLNETSDLFRRASQGMELSQKLLEKKIKKLFISKLKYEKNLSQEEVGKLLQNPDEFRQIVDDGMISDFMLSGYVEDEEIGKKDREKDYEEWTLALLRRIERWE